MNQSSPATSIPRGLRYRIVPLLLALSVGFVTLSFQLVWVRLAIQQLGSSASTVAVMMATALTGLSAGAMLCGRHADRSERPLLILGSALLAASILIFTTAAAAPTFAGWGEYLASFSTGRALEEPSLWQKLVFAWCAMFPVNSLLGTTLPLLVRHAMAIEARPKSFSRILGWLYGSETLGAAVGCMVVGFWSIQTLGLRDTLYLSAACIGTVGLLAIIFGRAPLPRSIPSRPVRQAGIAKRELSATPFLVIVALTASATLGMEVIWQRLFSVLFGSDTHSYAIVAASYLLGISLGAALSSSVMRLTHYRIPMYAFMVIAIATAATIVTGIALFQSSGNLSPFNIQLLTNRPVTARILISISLLLIPTTLIGIAFPIAATIWLTDLGRAASSTAQIYSAALIGNVAGVLIVGFCLIPALGLRNSFLVLAGICVFCGVSLLLVHLLRQTSQPRLTFQAVVFFAGIGLLLTAWAVTSGRLFRQFWPIGVASKSPDWKLDFYNEGPANTVAVVSRVDDPLNRRMIVDGVTIGESQGGVDEKQQMLAHLPFLLRNDRNGQRVITIGLGTGILAGELAQNPLVDEVWAVELSRSVIAAASHFSDCNGDLLDHPKARIVRADGIRFLNKTDILFDAIVSDAKSRPGFAGNLPFFSRDYYKRCQSRLASDGVFVQWVSLESSPDSIAVILQTFAGTFPFGHIAVAAPDSIYLVGTNQPMQLSRQYIQQRLATEPAQSLTRYSWRSYDDFTSLYWLDQQTVQAFFLDQATININTLNHPVLESYTLAEMGGHEIDNKQQNLEQLEQLFQFDQLKGVDKSRFNTRSLEAMDDDQVRNALMAGRQSARQIAQAARIQLEQDDHWLDNAAAHYRKAIEFTADLTRQNGLVELYRQLADQARLANRVDREFSALSGINELKSGTAADQHRLAEILLQFDKPEAALTYFHRAVTRDPANARYHADFAFGLLRLQKNAQALSRFRQVLKLEPDNAYGHAGLGIALIRDGQQESAWSHLRQAGESSLELRGLIEDHGVTWRSVLNSTSTRQ